MINLNDFIRWRFFIKLPWLCKLFEKHFKLDMQHQFCIHYISLV